jgi:hypothetical protein
MFPSVPIAHQVLINTQRNIYFYQYFPLVKMFAISELKDITIKYAAYPFFIFYQINQMFHIKRLRHCGLYIT